MSPPENPIDTAKKPRVGAILLGAGHSARMRDIDKIVTPLADRPLISHSTDTFEQSSFIDLIVLVVASHNVHRVTGLVQGNGWRKVTNVCIGGARRQDSVRAGLEHLSDCDLIVVHDGARPFVSDEIIANGVAVATEHGAAVAAIPVSDTIKLVNNAATVIKTLPRDGLWAIQTPQVFNCDLLQKAHREIHGDVTDDAAMVEAIGGTVKVFGGSNENIKVTTPEDWAIAQGILKSRQMRLG